MQAGLAGVHGNVSSFGSANGISVVALADFGKPGVGGVDGSSGATGKSSSGGSDSGFTLRTDKNPNTVRAGLTGEYQTAKGVIIRAGVSDNLRKGKNDLQGTSASG